MASEAQIAANRLNAAKSTGPRTEAGKAAASRNALKHGLTAEQLVLFDEDAGALAQFREELWAELAPAGAIEEALAERIVLYAWRLRRAARVEAALINAAAADVNNLFYQPGLGGAFRNATVALALALRYETAHERAMSRAQAMLERRQAQRRRGEPVAAPHENYETKPIPAPIAIDRARRAAADPIAADHENYETKPIPAPAPCADPLAGLDAPGCARQKRRDAVRPPSLPEALREVAADIEQAEGGQIWLRQAPPALAHENRAAAAAAMP